MRGLGPQVGGRSHGTVRLHDIHLDSMNARGRDVRLASRPGERRMQRVLCARGTAHSWRFSAPSAFAARELLCGEVNAAPEERVRRRPQNRVKRQMFQVGTMLTEPCAIRLGLELTKHTALRDGVVRSSLQQRGDPTFQHVHAIANLDSSKVPRACCLRRSPRRAMCRRRL